MQVANDNEGGKPKGRREKCLIVTTTKVYFIQASSGEVKIGYARWPERRLGELQMGHPGQMWLLCAVPGGRDLERKLHQEFASDHVRGEWFKYTKRMQDRIKQLIERPIHSRVL